MPRFLSINTTTILSTTLLAVPLLFSAPAQAQVDFEEFLVLQDQYAKGEIDFGDFLAATQPTKSGNTDFSSPPIIEHKTDFIVDKQPTTSEHNNTLTKTEEPYIFKQYDDFAESGIADITKTTHSNSKGGSSDSAHKNPDGAPFIPGIKPTSGSTGDDAFDRPEYSLPDNFFATLPPTGAGGDYGVPAPFQPSADGATGTAGYGGFATQAAANAAIQQAYGTLPKEEVAKASSSQSASYQVSNLREGSGENSTGLVSRMAGFGVGYTPENEPSSSSETAPNETKGAMNAWGKNTENLIGSGTASALTYNYGQNVQSDFSSGKQGNWGESMGYTDYKPHARKSQFGAPDAIKGKDGKNAYTYDTGLDGNASEGGAAAQNQISTDHGGSAGGKW